MTHRRSFLIACGALLGMGAMPALGKDGLTVTRLAEQSVEIVRETIEELTAVELNSPYQLGHGGQGSSYKGPLLWTVLERSKLLEGMGPHDRVAKIVRVTGGDGYVVALALGEIDPEFGGKQVILAYLRDGERLSNGELRLIVPSERRGGRSVRNVVRIELR